MDISTFHLLNPWRMGRDWYVPHIARTMTGKIEAWVDKPEIVVSIKGRES